MFLSLSVSLQVQVSEPGAAPGYKGITFCWAWRASVTRRKSKVGRSLFINRAFIDLQFKCFRGIGLPFDLLGQPQRRRAGSKTREKTPSFLINTPYPSPA